MHTIVRSATRASAAFLLLSTSVAVGCTTAPCPSGTLRDRDVCRRVSDSRDDDAPDASTAGGNARDMRTQANAQEDSKSGGRASEEQAKASAGEAGNIATTGRNSAGGAEKKTAAGSGGQSGATQAGAGTGAAAGTSAGPGSAPSGTPNASGSSGAAGSSTAAAGSKAAAGGAGAASAGGTGGGTQAGAGGDPAPSAPAADDWFCLDVAESCTCIAGGGIGGDACANPKPTCCFTLTALGTASCECWPSDSPECTESKTKADTKSVPTCPPGD